MYVHSCTRRRALTAATAHGIARVGVQIPRGPMLAFGGREIDDLSFAFEGGVDRRPGAATLKVPVQAPPGRGGFGPAFALTYSSSALSSPFAAGWSLAGLSSIGIDTSEHMSQSDGADEFRFGGNEIVPWLEPDGPSWRPRGFGDADWSAAYHRNRTGASQIRIEKWVDRHTGRVHSRTRHARNVLTIYGAGLGSTARLADPEDSTRTVAWLPELYLARRRDTSYKTEAVRLDDRSFQATQAK